MSADNKIGGQDKAGKKVALRGSSIPANTGIVGAALIAAKSHDDMREWDEENGVPHIPWDEWTEIPDRRDIAIKQVEEVAFDQAMTPKQFHEHWLDLMDEAGWEHPRGLGTAMAFDDTTTNPAHAKKYDPRMVDWDGLTVVEQQRTTTFLEVIKATRA